MKIMIKTSNTSIMGVTLISHLEPPLPPNAIAIKNLLVSSPRAPPRAGAIPHERRALLNSQRARRSTVVDSAALLTGRAGPRRRRADCPPHPPPLHTWRGGRT